MDKEHLASSVHIVRDEPHHAVTATLRPVDMKLPTINPEDEAHLPEPDGSERDDSILPEKVQGWLDSMGRSARRMRGATLSTLPAFVVNNSSNFIGLSHMAGEMAMIKAYSPIKTPEQMAAMEGKSRTVEEIKLFFNGAIKTVPFRMKASELLSPQFYFDNLRALKDLDFAAERDLARSGIISNRWGLRSTVLGMSGMALSAVLPEEHESEEEIERMARMRNENYAGYVGNRIGQAFNPFEWSSHKRQMAGLGLTLGGTCSFINGLMSATGGVKYTRNWGHAFGGAITAVAGAQLMTAVENESGWQNFGKTMSLRMLTLPNSIWGKYQKQQDGRHWYVGGQAAFRGTDALAYLIGGAEKLPDGTVVDKQAIRKEAELKARGIETIFDKDDPALAEAEKTSEKESPTAKVVDVKAHEKQAEIADLAVVQG